MAPTDCRPFNQASRIPTGRSCSTTTPIHHRSCSSWRRSPRLQGDFPAQRALWFGINGLLLAVGLWILARWLDGDGPGSHRVLLLAPVFLGSLPVLGTLQIGNFQIAVVMLSILAMVAFHQDRNVIGGALLAFAILSKISPGIFGVYLLSQRRFRSAAWTAGFGVFFLAAVSPSARSESDPVIPNLHAQRASALGRPSPSWLKDSSTS
jgi:hypothetical protein